MPFAFIFIGLILIIVGFRGEHERFNATLRDDFTGSTNYVYWVAAILALGAVGSVKSLRGLSDAFIVLLVLVLFLSNKGFFAKLEEQLS